MAYREELQKKIKKQEEEIVDLEGRLRDSRTYLQGLMDAMRLLPREANVSKSVSLRQGSSVAHAREAILKAGKPLHISEILKALGKADDKESRASLSSGIAAYARKGEIFVRTEPNTFGLRELNHQEVREEFLALVNDNGSTPSDANME